MKILRKLVLLSWLILSGTLPLAAEESVSRPIAMPDGIPQACERPRDLLAIPNSSIVVGSFRLPGGVTQQDGVAKPLFYCLLGSTAGNKTFHSLARLSTPLTHRANFLEAPTFGISPDGRYLVIDARQFHTWGIHDLFLFRIGQEGLELLDEIEYGEKEGMFPLRFTAEEPGTSPEEQQHPVAQRMEIGDQDGDGFYDIKLLLYWSDVEEEPENRMHLFLRIEQNRLRVELNPALYLPYFQQQMQLAEKSGFKSHAYDYYGYLSRKLTLKEVFRNLRSEQDPRGDGDVTGPGHYFGKKMINTLRRMEEWDALLHEAGSKNPFRLVETALPGKP